ncbi:C39 family peptidase [Patescibacteria group bacterium]|nr:C39 family peptidase [Patescibacteria group bacterium]MBU1448587.1 C39 family peptidase [Patescibacteria group bacterium]MBU2613267.1 C39 family peptidase [Patescibacteria group bacterium]
MAIDLNPFRQSSGLCGPASLKILLDHYGRSFTEDELVAMCDATAERGTDHADMLKAVENIGGTPEAKDGATVDDLREAIRHGLPVVVGWYSTYSEPGDHFSVVYDIDEDTISLMDPERDEGSVTMPIEEFKKAWYDFDGPEDVRVDRWMMTVPAFATTNL